MKPIKPRCIVIDTNVIISAGILPNSPAAKAVATAFDHFVLAQNEKTWDELITRIQRRKLDHYFTGQYARAEYLLYINTNTEFFEIESEAAGSVDLTDNKFLGLAVDAGAEIIISGDGDLKDLQHYKGIEILSPAEFRRRYEQ